MSFGRNIYSMEIHKHKSELPPTQKESPFSESQFTSTIVLVLLESGYLSDQSMGPYDEDRSQRQQRKQSELLIQSKAIVPVCAFHV